MNRRSIGICYIGGMSVDMKRPEDTRTEPQRTALRKLTEDLCTKYRIPKERVFGHRDFAPKACPSFDVRSLFTPLIIAMLFCLAVFSSSCTRTIYLPIENREVSHDSAYRSVRIMEQSADRDTILIEIRGDTIRERAVSWRWRTRVSHDTVVEHRCDTIRIRETLPPASTETTKKQSKNQALFWIPILILIIIAGRWLLRVLR